MIDRAETVRTLDLEDTRFEIHHINRGYSLTITDIDSGSRIPSVPIYKTLEAANAAFDKIVAA